MKRKALTARTADKYALYQEAVQAPEADLALFERVYRRLRGRRPTTFREDFCGTAFLSATWVAQRPVNSAWAVDLDPVPLAWGEQHVRRPLGEAARRLHMVRGDVRTARVPRCDITCAMNFSFCCFKNRRDLVRYFASARASLARGGVFFLDAFGGSEGGDILEETRQCRGFVYRWQQEDSDPISGSLRTHIHFDFPDGTTLRRAFSYDWRAWGLPELRDCLADAGFRATRVFWEMTDARGNGTGAFREASRATPCESFVCCVAAHD